MRGRSGSSLFNALLVSGLSLMLLLAVAQAMVFQHHFALHDDDAEHARNLAEGVIYKEIAKLCRAEGDASPAHFALGDDRRPNTGDLTFTAGAGIPHSTNNLAGATSRVGFGGRRVPAGTAHLLGVGRYGGARVSLECYYYHPPFPRGVVSRGPIELLASEILGLAPEAVFGGDWSSIPPNQRIPAHAFSNATGNPGLHLSAGSKVSGNAASRGEVVVDAGATVEGEVQSGAAAQEVPAFDIDQMITRVGGAAGLHPYVPGLPVDDFVTTPGGLTVGGNLVMDGGVLAVRGNLLVTGAIRGHGVLLVSGNTTIQHGAAFEADRQVAILSKGSLTLRGNPSSSLPYFFQGLLYSEGAILADHLTVLGSVVCNSLDATAPVRLTEVRLITTPVHVISRQGLPVIGHVADDTYRFFFQCRPDPLHPGQKLFYGKADYCEAYDYDTAREPITLRVYFVPGEVLWEVSGTIVERRPFDGKPASVQAEMERLAGYYGEVGGTGSTVSDYLGALSAGATSSTYLDINLNQVLGPVERARILSWGVPLER